MLKISIFMKCMQQMIYSVECAAVLELNYLSIANLALGFIDLFIAFYGNIGRYIGYKPKAKVYQINLISDFRGISLVLARLRNHFND